MPIQHFKRDAPVDEIVGVLRRDGCAIIDALAEPGALERVSEEMAAYLDATPLGTDAFTGDRTRRTGGLIARSPAAREITMNSKVLEVTAGVLEKSTNFHLHLTQIIAIGPGESAQVVHRDQWAFDFFPFPAGFEVQCNTIWAMTDFTEANGATRAVVGSNQFEDGREFKFEDTEPAEMERGSCLLYTGALYHGGGANQSDAVRMGLNITYARGWLRQEENQYLTVPLEVAQELDEDLQKLIGYQRGAYALGYVDDLREPLQVLRADASAAGLGGIEDAARQAVAMRGSRTE
jgi:ectoine hydroxylase-related dioxygenase (phytanoyl-CoA dioxygenase family)